MKKVYRKSLYVLFPFVVVPANTIIVVSKQVWEPTCYLAKQALRPPIYASKRACKRLSNKSGLAELLKEKPVFISSLELMSCEIQTVEQEAAKETNKESATSEQRANKPRHIKGGERPGKNCTKRISLDFEIFHSIQEKIRTIKSITANHTELISIGLDIVDETVKETKEVIKGTRETTKDTKETIESTKGATEDIEIALKNSKYA